METYNNFEQKSLPLGIVVSSGVNLKYFRYEGEKSAIYGFQLLVCAALENVIVYNSKTLQTKFVLEGEQSLVTFIEAKISKIAVGYRNGCIKIWDLDYGNSPLAFDGHSSSVTTLEFDDNCSRLVSGGEDTYIILWDVLAECGMYRLKGHTGAITRCRFMNTYSVIVSSSKDKSIKFWDLVSQHCFSTLQDTDFAVSDFVFEDNESHIISADTGGDLKVWEILPISRELKQKRQDSNLDIVFTCNFIFTTPKKANSGSKSLLIDQRTMLLFCLNFDSTIEIFKINQSKKTKKISETKTENNLIESSYLKRIGEISEKKIVSIEFFTDEKKKNILYLSNKNNSITMYHIEILKNLDLKYSQISVLASLGHRSPPQCVTFNSNSQFFASGSANEIKIWSIKHKVCTITMQTEHCLCLLYAPGDRYIMSGTKSGSINIYDAITGDVYECIKAHNGAINDMKIMPNGLGLASASDDSTVKFFLFKNEDKISLDLVRQLDMDESISCICYSHCQKFISVTSLNDVKIFFDDTLKYYLTLYGHKLNINSIDISHDNEILISGSSDKNIKIWGLNFGECRKSIYAHNAQINKVFFIPKTHMFFSCGKDGLIKLWDGDSFKMILELKGHQKEIFSFALNSDGETLISVSRDFSLRIWEQSDEVIVPENHKDDENDTNVPGIQLIKEAEKEVLAHWKPTYNSLRYTENLVDALDIVIKIEKNPEDSHHPVLESYNMKPSEYVLHVLSMIPTNDLDVSLTTLPYKYVILLLTMIKSWMGYPHKLELCIRCISFLVKLHFYQIINSPDLLSNIHELNIESQEKISNIQSTVGVNLESLKFMKRKIEKDSHVFIYEFIKPKKN